MWLLAALAGSILVWFTGALAADVEASGFSTIDPRRARIEPAGAYCDTRWSDQLAQAIAGRPPVDARDRSAIQALADDVALLPFVAEVGEPSVLWPDGLDLPLVLRQPAACVRVRGEFVCISDDGVVLPGGWPIPPWVGEGFLPVLGPNDGGFDGLAAGERLSEPRHVDALSVAVSMREALTRADFEALGPPLIDATRARAASVEEPGVRIELEGRRTAWFGRAPNAGEPGELPTPIKWASLQRALRLLDDPTNRRDWSLVDLRWDTPDLRWRDAAHDGSATKGG